MLLSHFRLLEIFSTKSEPGLLSPYVNLAALISTSRLSVDHYYLKKQLVGKHPASFSLWWRSARIPAAMTAYYGSAEQKAYKNCEKETGNSETQTLGVWEAQIQFLVLTLMWAWLCQGRLDTEKSICDYELILVSWSLRGTSIADRY